MHTSQTAWYGTTIICVRRNNEVVIAGDGQITLGNQVIKHSAEKLRLLSNGKILAGFAGATADAFSLFERLDEKIQHQDKIGDSANRLEKAVVELSKDWRTDQMLRKFEAMLIVADSTHSFILTGVGDVLKPEPVADGEICAIGSGGTFALSAGTALLSNTNLSAQKICEKSLAIAANICIHTNDQLSSISLTYDDKGATTKLNRRTKDVHTTDT